MYAPVALNNVCLRRRVLRINPRLQMKNLLCLLTSNVIACRRSHCRSDTADRTSQSARFTTTSS